MEHCIACGGLLPEACLFELENAPASAQDIPDESQVKTDRGVTLRLYQCGCCGLVQFACRPVSYYRDVIRAGGGTATMRELRTRQYRHLIETYHLENQRFLEVGCGQGEFLEFLAPFPVDGWGMEHKAGLVEKARAKGLKVWQDFPEEEHQRFPGAPWDVFLSFNFLEHQPRPEVMLRAIWNNLREGGMGLVTVPSLEYILEKGSYYELIRDHLAYYSFGTLRRLLGRCGFEVLEEERVNKDTLSVIVRRAPGPVEEARREAEVDVSPLVQGFWRVQEEMDRLKSRMKAEKKTLAMWGASHQGFTLASTTALADSLEYIIDSAPFKQGRFAPASHIPIVAPEVFQEKPTDGILIAAPGYTEEIREIIKTRFGNQADVMWMRTNRIERG